MEKYFQIKEIWKVIITYLKQLIPYLKQVITYLKQNKKIAAFSAVVAVVLVYSAASGGKNKAGARMEVEIEGVKVAFRWCPPGEFTRQWDESTQEYWEEEPMWDDDKRDFTITLTKGFWLAETEATQELWVAVTGENPSEGVRKKRFR